MTGGSIFQTQPLDVIMNIRFPESLTLLTAARDEAQRRGLFTRRPTPLNVQDVLAVGKSA